MLIDGINVKDLGIHDLRSLIGNVNQEAILFNDTIKNNIMFGKDDATEEDVIRAAKIANAYEFIMQTEHGFDTNIGDRGGRLSGGQRQRISIARAILKNPPILILDEATSALDTESERLVQDALYHLMKTRTTVAVAHRLSTIKNADEICVFARRRSWSAAHTMSSWRTTVTTINCTTCGSKACVSKIYRWPKLDISMV